MAVLTIRDEDRTLTESQEISDFLGQFGIWYRRFEDGAKIEDGASNEDILALYDAPIQQLKAEGGYVTADVINIVPTIEGLDGMLAKFSREHWHDEDEVRFIVRGRGLFHLHPKDGPVFSIEVVQGDMINVPKGTLHWFDLCKEKMICAIRLFQDPSGWTPHYTESQKEEGYIPMCFGPAFIAPVDATM